MSKLRLRSIALAMLGAALAQRGTPLAHAAEAPMELRAAFARLHAIPIWATFKCAALAIGGRDVRWMPWGVDQLEKIRPSAVVLAEQVVKQPGLWVAMDLDGEAAGTFPVTINPEFLAGMWFQAVWDKQRFIMQSDMIEAQKAGVGFEHVWRVRFIGQRCDRPNFQEWLFDFGQTGKAER